MARQPKTPAAKPSYREMLLDPRWQKRRLQILERDEFACTCCESTDRTLHIHHKRYRWNIPPWDYSDDELDTLCEVCHTEVTAATNALKDAMTHLGVGSMSRTAGYAVGQQIDRWFIQADPPAGIPVNTLAPWAQASIKLTDYEMAVGIAHGVSESGFIDPDVIVSLVSKDGMLSLELVAQAIVVKP